MRAVLVTGLAALLLAWPAAATNWRPSAAWLLEAKCVHLKEGPWSANAGNGNFGGFQLKADTWKRVGGAADPAFTHPGIRRTLSTRRRASSSTGPWLLWRHDGRTWRSWGAVGASCS